MTTQAWIVLQDAITPAYPEGDCPPQPALTSSSSASLAGQLASVTSAQGPAVCNGDPQTQQTYSPPYLVFAGESSLRRRLHRPLHSATRQLRGKVNDFSGSAH